MIFRGVGTAIVTPFTDNGSVDLDSFRVVGPAYNKPTQSGFEAHVSAILESSSLPCILYNVPGRSQFNILPETILSLADQFPQIVGVKEASGNLTQVMDLLSQRPSGFAVYSGDDELAFPIACLGGDGVISVVSNVLPKQMSSMMSMALTGLIQDAREIHYQILEIIRACFIETNPIPIKAMLNMNGHIQNELRLPLLPLADQYRNEVYTALNPIHSRTEFAHI